jgi:hypothetical protein
MQVKRTATIIITLLVAIVSVFAGGSSSKKQLKQFKKDIDSVKVGIKKMKDLETSERIVRKHLSDSLYRDDIKLHELLIEVLTKEYERGNEKAYLKQQVDTACLMHTCHRLFVATEKLDSLDHQHGLKYAKELAPLRANLLVGGVYFLNHQNYDDAWTMIDAYMACREKALFEAEKLDDSNDGRAAFYAILVAMNSQKPHRGMKYEEDAMGYSLLKEKALEMLATLSMMPDSVAHTPDELRYLAYLKRGFEEYPTSEYFFPRLLDYYMSKGDNAEAMCYAEEALRQDSANVMFLLGKHNVLMRMGKYDDVIDTGQDLLKRDSTLALANYNVGYAYYHKGRVKLSRRSIAYRQRVREAQKLYRKCLSYMERYRELAPGDAVRWRPVLYDVYLNLNMGAEFEKLKK